ncbi:hypothetical protein JRQ81_009381 [Phrynocephalus forsythii]|uniref:Protein misato homolog 1 n=1 Tax=Phrynocephalus forsythii TaxID=171643 RepID=A0A9Q1ASH2_9SAUR|nr:hypothetical protein JRQ81_009381 [Phrynocephalus forsythii]
MSGAREVVTLQLGPYAGSVGAHWWRIQEALLCCGSAAEESLCHNVLFRAGKTPHGQETYTPRLILTDLKGNLSSFQQKGSSCQDTKSDSPTAWRGSLSTHQEDPLPANPFLHTLNRQASGRTPDGNLASWTHLSDSHPRPNETPKTSGVETAAPAWPDFLRTPLHPRSILTIHQYHHEGDSSRLEAFGQGEKLLQEGAYPDELEDRLHFYVEECDYLQGFQVLCDLQSGFSGVGARATELLQDEYAGKGILTWGLTPVLQPTIPQRNFYQLMNTVLGLVKLSTHSSLFCPLSLNGSLGLRPQPPVSLPYLHYEPSLDYHTSAILAATLDTLTSPYRLQASPLSMVQLAEALTFSGRKVAAVTAAVPFPASHGQSLPEALCGHQTSLPGTSLSSCGEPRDEHCFAQSVVLRGISKEHQVSHIPSGSEPRSVLHMCETGQEVLARYLYTVSPRTFSTSHLLQAPCRLLAPFPQFFSPLVNKHGFLLEKPLQTFAAVESIPVFTALQASAALHKTLRALYEELRQVDVRRWASFFSAGMETDDFVEALEGLRTLSHCYKESGSEDNSEDETD